MKRTNQHFLGLIFALLMTITYGFYSVFSHYFVETFDPITFSGLATFIGSFPLLIMLKRGNNHKYIFSKSKYLTRLLLIAILTGLATIFFFVGTKLTSGINTSLLLQIEPIYSVILAYFLLGEIVGLGQFTAIALMILGACVVVFKGLTVPNIGDVLILITPMFYQLSHVVTKKIIHDIPDTNIIPAARLFYGGLILTCIGLILHPHSILPFFEINNFLLLLLFSLLFMTIDHILWYQALQRIPLSLASAFLPVSLIVSFTGSIVILKEIPSVQQYFGLVTIFIGLIWISILHLKTHRA